MPSPPIDPLTSPKYALDGRVVTMNPDFTVLDRGVIYIDAGTIVAVEGTGDPYPPGFEDAPMIRTGSTIYPGLIELHNHLSYNVLPLWDVPQAYTNRSKWAGTPIYQKLVTGPMKVLGQTPEYVAPLVRYVECKCLLGGVTTSQGIALFSNQGIRKYYRGIVRNVEETNEAALPEAKTRISDVDAKDAGRFRERLGKSTCLLLHLSEGIDTQSRQHFQALRLGSGEWAITDALTGIHCAGLRKKDFGILSENGGSMVWSPLSNYLLYGATADIEGARSEGVLIGIGSDWAPSGSKNLLGELKIAKLVSDELGGLFRDREILQMATGNAARILKWDRLVGSIEAGKRADLLALFGRKGDPYEMLLKSRESSIVLVTIDGVPRYGQSRLMEFFGGGTEQWQVANAKRTLNLKQETADPIVGALTLREARDRLRNGMRRIAGLAKALEDPEMVFRRSSLATSESIWYLALDHDEPAGEAHRPHLPGPRGVPTGFMAPSIPRVKYSEILEPVELDELTVVDDSTFLERIMKQKNVPDFIKKGLREMY
jgi:5-methylthioadenosine/S-adenosylhomocysteine deaminase